MRARFHSFALSLFTSPHLSPDQVSQVGLRCLRRIACLLALCVAWSFALGPAALAAKAPAETGAHGTAAPLQSPSLVQIWREAQQAQRKQQEQERMQREMAAHAGLIGPPPPRTSARPPAPSVTLLDEVGQIARPVSVA